MVSEMFLNIEGDAAPCYNSVAFLSYKFLLVLQGQW